MSKRYSEKLFKDSTAKRKPKLNFKEKTKKENLKKSN